MKQNKYKISEERILQISNDISEDMCCATNLELIEVVKYFRDQFDIAHNNYLIEKGKLAVQLLKLATEVATTKTYGPTKTSPRTNKH